ncbi:glycosyltransferase family 39 protein [Nocardioides sp. R-C-SC26]|uniref:glycosyltransferase family 39 protein n=1 Tax=Nocardioides sp. R-C-SC26 TaxID=2870414 RepID=UPI001E36D70D|nr:glycosyltransferase family 39 protein [Nocardioides sp. R-C-SC26]
MPAATRVRRAVSTLGGAPALLALGLVVVAGATIRILAHAGVAYSPADEGVYAAFSCGVERGGLGVYPDLVRGYLADPGAHVFPSPIRWGQVLLGALAFEVRGCDPAALAWVSTFAGIAMILLAAAIAGRLWGRWAAVVAAILVAASPLQLHLGRRALGDELVGLAGLAAVAAAWWCLRSSDRRARLALALALTVMLALKEVAVLLFPAIALCLAVGWWRRRRVGWGDVVALTAPLVVWAGVYSLLARSFSAVPDTLRAVTSTIEAPYPRDYQSGPPHRLLIDLLALAPVATVLAILAVGLLADRARRGAAEARVVAATTAAALLPYLLVSSKSVRFVVVVDSLICLLAAWAIVTLARQGRGGRMLGAALTAGAVLAQGAIFWAFSIRDEIYDPVTYEILRSLGMIP